MFDVVRGTSVQYASVIDSWVLAGCIHLLVSWPGRPETLARHTVTRAATVGFPEQVATLAETM
ncbi:MAG: hypothetical protein ACPGQI_09510 [Gammaproteobacteria bacterium]